MHLDDLNLLPILHAVLETGSVQKAARRVSLSPSATSHALARARDALRDPLLVRAGRELVPTARGLRIRERLGPLLAELDALLADDRALDPTALEREFRVACGDYAELTLIQPLGIALAERSPGVALYCQNPVGRFFEGLREGEVDLAIGVYEEIPSDFRMRSLVSEGFVCAMRPDHPVAGQKLTLERYLQLDHVLIAPRGTPEGVVDRVLARQGLKRRVARVVSNFLAAPLLVAESDYVVTMSRRVLDAIAGRVELVRQQPPLDLAGYEVSAVWHQRSDSDPALQWLVNELASTATS